MSFWSGLENEAQKGTAERGGNITIKGLLNAPL
jgi:hypothetical protein